MLLAFELSGEHETLPKSEVLACLNALEIDYSVIYSLDQCLVIECKPFDKSLIKVLKNRLAMTHRIIEVIEICDAKEESIFRVVDILNLKPYIYLNSFVVRAKVKNCNIDTAYLERRIGAIIYKKGYRVDLENPDIYFRVIIIKDKCIFGILVDSIDRSQFEDRKPQKKPFFFPGVLMPKIARALVNLSQVKSGDILCDPFCGTAGILVEAMLIDIKVIGIDVQSKMVKGSKINLEYYNNNSYTLIVGDACNIPLKAESISAIVTDLPYGISTKIFLKNKKDLYKESLKEIYRILKNKGHIVIVSNKLIEEKIIGFEIVEKHKQRVHKSLTRYIYVLKKVL
ncbi:MAG: TIGR01177 family methyltransferase [Methanosarcinales archaeon]